MSFISLRGATAALAMMAACGSAHAFSAKGNYDVTFTVPGGSTVEYCVTLATQGPSGPYRDVGSTTFYSDGASIATGTYVVYKKTISVAVTPGGSDFLTASGQFAAGQTFNTAVIEFLSGATIVGTATFTEHRNGGSCAKSSS